MGWQQWTPLCKRSFKIVQTKKIDFNVLLRVLSLNQPMMGVFWTTLYDIWLTWNNLELCLDYNYVSCEFGGNRIIDQEYLSQALNTDIHSDGHVVKYTFLNPGDPKTNILCVLTMKNIQEIYIHNIKYASVPQWRPQSRFGGGGLTQPLGVWKVWNTQPLGKIFQN